MQKDSSSRSGFLFGVISLLIIVSMYALPGSAQAQIYPFTPGSSFGPAATNQTLNPVSSCTPPAISGFTPYIYEGELHSFDYFVDNQPGTRYLPLGVTINGTPIDLNYVSVWRNVGTDRIKVHVDVPFEDLNGGVAIGISVLQITQGPPPVCPTTASFHVNLPFSTPAPSAPEAPGAPSTPTTDPVTPIGPQQPTQPKTPETPGAPVIPGTTTPREGKQCTELSLWWLALLIILDILISATLLLFMSFIVKTNARLIVAVLLPPIVFLGLWYFLNTCHTHIWFPIFAVLLGIGVLTASGSPETFDGMRDNVRNRYRRMREYFVARPKTTTLVIPPAQPQQPQQKKPFTPPTTGGEVKKEENKQ